jgi:hypothetical protein
MAVASLRREYAGRARCGAPRPSGRAAAASTAGRRQAGPLRVAARPGRARGHWPTPRSTPTSANHERATLVSRSTRTRRSCLGRSSASRPAATSLFKLSCRNGGPASPWDRPPGPDQLRATRCGCIHALMHSRPCLTTVLYSQPGRDDDNDDASAPPGTRSATNQRLVRRTPWGVLPRGHPPLIPARHKRPPPL